MKKMPVMKLQSADSYKLILNAILKYLFQSASSVVVDHNIKLLIHFKLIDKKT